MIKYRIINNAWWMFWAKGMVFGPWIWMKYRHVDPNPPTVSKVTLANQNKHWNKRLFRHELEHCYQMQRDGWWKFHAKYLWFQIRYGYKKNPYEIEAYERQNEKLTDEEQRWMESGTVRLSR